MSYAYAVQKIPPTAPCTITSATSNVAKTIPAVQRRQYAVRDGQYLCRARTLDLGRDDLGFAGVGYLAYRRRNQAAVALRRA